MQTQWILNKSKFDIPFILFPGILGILLAFTLSNTSLLFLVYAFIVITFIDSGHVYITVWRTVFRKAERTSHPTYWLTPLLTCVSIFLWMKFKVPFLWGIVVYFTIYHHMRQFYGVLRWYEKINKRFCKTSNRLLYVLTVLPFVLAHFRNLHIEYYTANDLINFTSPTFFFWGMVLYCITVIGWLGFELSLYKKGIREKNRFFAMLGPAVIYAYCFLIGDTVIETVLPLLLAHGIPYFSLMNLSLKKLNPKHSFLKKRFIIPILIFTGCAFSVFEALVEENVLMTVNYNYMTSGLSDLQYWLTGLFLTPLICHYVWDAHIWTGKHREAKIVYS